MSRLKFRAGDVCEQCGLIRETARSTLARELLQHHDYHCECKEHDDGDTSD